MFSPHLDDACYEDFSALIYRLTGISLGPAKRALVATRLNKRLRLGGFTSFRAYHEHVTSKKGKDELQHMIDVISTNKTAFFREPAHFDFLAKTVIPQWKRGPIRIWSAACSSGEEPYTIAMVLTKHLPHWQQRDIKILATDISNRILDKAEAGVYSQCRELPNEVLKKNFLKGEGPSAGSYLIRQELRELIRFRYLNLMESFPFKGRFQAIFCRNVMIYFDNATRERLIAKLTHYLQPGGYLFVGHSESLGNIEKGNLHYVLPAIYQKR